MKFFLIFLTSLLPILPITASSKGSASPRSSFNLLKSKSLADKPQQKSSYFSSFFGNDHSVETTSPTSITSQDLLNSPTSSSRSLLPSKSTRSIKIPNEDSMQLKMTSNIDTWLQDFAPEIRDRADVQMILQDEILQPIFKIDRTTQKINVTDPAIDLQTVKTKLNSLITQYKDNHQVISVLKNTQKKIDLYEQTNSSIALQTNTTTTPFYNRTQALQILKSLNISPKINPATGALENMPSIEMINELAQENPTAQTFEILNNTIKTVRIARYALKKDKSPNSKQIQDQLKKYDAQLNQTLLNPHFDQYKSVMFKNLLDATGVGSMTVSAALDYFKSGIQTASTVTNKITEVKNDALLNSAGYAAAGLGGYARMGATGAFVDVILYHLAKEHAPSALQSLKDMTLNQFLDIMSPSEKTSILNAEKNMQALQTNNITLQGEITKLFKGTNKQQIAQVQKDANNEIVQYYYADQARQDLFDFMKIQPKIDPTTGSITNMPSVQDIIQKAQENPSQQAYQALKAAVTATDIALYANKYDLVDWMMYNTLKVDQLFLYKNQLNKALENPAIIRYQSSLNRALNYTTSLLPKSYDLAKASGVLDTTFDQLAQGNTYTNRLIDAGLQQSGMANKTVNQVLTSAELIPATL